MVKSNKLAIPLIVLIVGMVVLGVVVNRYKGAASFPSYCNDSNSSNCFCSFNENKVSVTNNGATLYDCQPINEVD